MSFVGAKGGAGVYQRIICWMPPHDVYVEPFAGIAAVWRRKRPAKASFLVDSDPDAIDALGDVSSSWRTRLLLCDGIRFLTDYLPFARGTVLAYCDPPYMRECRVDPTPDYYREEWTTAQHKRFLDTVLELPYLVLVSGYWSPLYADKLAGWSTDHFTTTTRAGPAEEWLWANYPRPDELHDYRYIGESFGQRWRIHKRQRRWVRMLSGMPPLERRAMLAAIADGFGEDLQKYLAGGLDSNGVADRTTAGGDKRSTSDRGGGG